MNECTGEDARAYTDFWLSGLCTAEAPVPPRTRGLEDLPRARCAGYTIGEALYFLRINKTRAIVPQPKNQSLRAALQRATIPLLAASVCEVVWNRIKIS